MSLAEVIKTALDQFKCIAKTETVIGEPITAGEVTLIPISSVSIGFGAGGGNEKEKGVAGGSGTGGGIKITPIAFIAIHGDHVQVHPVSASSDQIMGKILSVAPDIIGKISKYWTKKDEIPKDKKEKK